MSARTASERLFSTEDGRLVSEDDPDARQLVCIEGEEIPEGFDAPSAKKAAPARNKAAAKPADK